MARTNPVQPGEFALEEFFLYLRDLGFPCGVGERVRALRVYAAAVSSRPDRLKTILCPIFARSEADQERFYRAYDLFFTPAAARETAPALPGEEPIQAPAQHVNNSGDWTLRRSALRLLSLLAFVGLLFYFDVPGKIRSWFMKPPVIGGQTQSPPSKPGFTFQEVTRTRTVSVKRGCQGMECLTYGRRPWILGGVVLWLALSPLAARTGIWRRHRLLRRERQRRGPFSWRLVRHSPSLTAYRGVLLRVADAMRLRIAGDIDDLDVAKTIDATIKKAGFPDFRFRPRLKTPEYLFLIEKKCEEDHLANWWHEVAQSLQRLGVSIQAYFYSGDLRQCSPAGSSLIVNTSHLLDGHESRHVLVFGRGRDLLQGFGHFPSWIDAALVRRDHRALLTAAASFEWGSAEQRVRLHMPVVPARVRNLSTVTVGADTATAVEREDTDITALAPEYFEETEEEARGGPPSLSAFLDEDVFEWLCACAVYPKLEWRLTVEIGSIIDPSGAIFEERKLLQLIRIAWFRDGKIPGRWRAWLIKFLPPDKAAVVRKFLVESLERNRAPQGSFARDQQDLQIAAQRYWLEPKSAERLVALRSALAAMPAVDVAEDYLLAQMSKAPRARATESRTGVAWEEFRQEQWKYATGAVAILIAVAAVMYFRPISVQQTQTYKEYMEVPVQKVAPPVQKVAPRTTASEVNPQKANPQKAAPRVDPSNLTLRVTVTDDGTGNPIAGALVEVITRVSSLLGRTDGTGTFSVRLPGGPANVRVSAPGYRSRLSSRANPGDSVYISLQQLTDVYGSQSQKSQRMPTTKK